MRTRLRIQPGLYSQTQPWPKPPPLAPSPCKRKSGAVRRRSAKRHLAARRSENARHDPVTPVSSVLKGFCCSGCGGSTRPLIVRRDRRRKQRSRFSEGSAPWPEVFPQNLRSLGIGTWRATGSAARTYVWHVPPGLLIKPYDGKVVTEEPAHRPDPPTGYPRPLTHNREGL